MPGPVAPAAPTAAATVAPSPSATLSGGRQPSSRRAGRTFFARTRLADGERPSLEWLLIEAADGSFRDGAVGVIDEREPSRTPGLPIHREDDLGWFANARQVFPQLGFGRGVRQIPDKQTD